MLNIEVCTAGGGFCVYLLKKDERVKEFDLSNGSKE